MKIFINIQLFLTATFLLTVSSMAGCANHGISAPAPIIDAKPSSTQTIHTVAYGESLYAIAWRYGKDYRELAKLNNLNPPYHIAIGQPLRLTNKAILPENQPKHSAATATIPPITIAKPNNKPAAIVNSSSNNKQPTTIETTSATKIDEWQWPVSGKVIGTYGSTIGGKGINIATKLAEPVHASAAGQVVYAGSNLRGYGQLIIIKHNTEFLSAYAHNSKLLVKEGDIVKAGQVIAETGDTESDRVMLHFEIRQGGKPVDPLLYLPK